MNTTAMGSGIEPVEMPTVESDAPVAPMPFVESPSDTPPVEMPTGLSTKDLLAAMKAEMREEIAAGVADAERRLAQAREIERAIATGVPRETVHAEDLNINKHLIDGYLLTANSPTAGKIAWSSLHVVLMGVDYTIADGNTDKKYSWFIKPGSGTTASLVSGDVLPTLGPNDALIFVNNAGSPVSALESSISYAVGPGVIGNDQLAASVQQTLSTLSANDIAMQSAIDGSITSYYQNEPPWPNGAPSPAGGNINQGDVWYDSNDGGAFRWTGTGGTPANTWQRIADTDVASVAALAGTKTTTYVGSSAPVAPAGGFTNGDLWIDSANGNLLKRWQTNAWVSLQVGDAAISGVAGNKVGAGILPTNITGAGTMPVAAVPTLDLTAKTSGNLTGSRVAAGVSPSVLTGAGTAPVAAIPTLTPAKLNTAFHMLY